MARAPRASGFQWLVEAGSHEAASLRRLWPDAPLLPFALGDARVPTTASLLAASDIGEVMRDGGVRHLLFTPGWSAAVDAWARTHDITLVGPAREHRRDLEDKLWFHRFLVAHDLPQPRGSVRTLSGLEVTRPLVIQEPRSSGGAGTWFVDSTRELDALVADRWLDRTSDYLVRERVDGVALGVTIVVTPDLVALSALRRQCYFDAVDGRADFAGVQWLPTSALTPASLARANTVFARLGGALHDLGFVGQANVDFMLGDDIYVLECNPRMSAASPQLVHEPALIHGLDVADRLLAAWLTPRARTRPVVHLIPETSYEGATLDLLAPDPLTRAPRPRDSDPRGLAPGRPFIHVAPASTHAPGSALASIIADDRLYDDGRLDALGQRWLAELAMV